MKFIRDKKIHKAIVISVLFLALGFSGFYAMRGVLASYTASGLFIFNDVVAFILSALIGGAIFELILFLLCKGLSGKIGASRAQDMRYAFRFFAIPAGIMSGLLKLLYFSYPFLFSYGEVLFEFFFM